MSKRKREIIKICLIASMLILPAMVITVIIIGVDSMPFITLNTGSLIITVVSVFMLLIGTILMMRIIINFVSELTNNLKYLQIITISIAFTIGLFIMNYDYGMSNSDRGVIFEIIGFLVYLTPIKKYLADTMLDEDQNRKHLVNAAKQNDENAKHYEQLVGYVAIVLVIFGLFLQLSTYNQ